MITLKSNTTVVTISELGAEIKSLTHNGVPVIASQEPHWNRTAPLLYPYIGKHPNREARHGYARDSLFKIVDQDDHSVELEYEAKGDQLEFGQGTLNVLYKLYENVLTLDVLVIPQKDFVYSFGFHPAFVLPTQTGTTLRFSNTRTKAHRLSDHAGSNTEWVERDSVIRIGDKFDDAIVAKPSEHRCTLKTDTYKMKMSWSNAFDECVLWSKSNAPFLCIEPWRRNVSTEETCYFVVDMELS